MKILLFSFFILISIISVQHVFSEEDNGSVKITVSDIQNNLLNPWGVEIKVYQDTNDNLFFTSHSITNPYTISDLPLGHTYFLQINRHDTFGEMVKVVLNKLQMDVKVTIRDLSGVQIHAFFKDGKPMTGSIVRIYSDEGNKWGESLITDEGLSERFWLQSPSLKSDYYVAVITTPGGLVVTSPIIRPTELLDLKMTSEWSSVIDDLITVNLYTSESTKVIKSDGNFLVELYNKQSTKVAESKADNKGQAFFSNIKPGAYIFRVMKLSQDGSMAVSEWSSKEVLLVDNPEPIKIISYSSSDTSIKGNTGIINDEEKAQTCNCVAFRIDGIQDDWLNAAQLSLLDFFESKQLPITVGIIGENFGKDSKIVDMVKRLRAMKLLEVGNNGKVIDIASLTKEEQSSLLEQTNNQIYDVLGIKPSIFIPIYGNYNSDTLDAMKSNNMQYISAISFADPPPYNFQNTAIYRTPATASTGFVEPGNSWHGKTSQSVLTSVKFSLKNNGFAVIMLNPHEYSIRENWDFKNEVDVTQMLELKTIVENLQREGVKIVPMTSIKDYIKKDDTPISVINTPQRIILNTDITNGTNLITLSGHTVIGKEITLSAITPTGKINSIAQSMPDSNGNFSFKINTTGNLWKENGIYTIIVKQGVLAEHEQSIQVEINNGVVVPEFGAIAVTILAIALISIIIISAKSNLNIISRY